MVEYTYTAWGYLRYTTGSLASTLGAKNHLRYRGYYYDTDMGLYYLMSRYYDPRTGRFINADDTAYIGADGSFASYSLFTYCNNNPVMNSDPFGYAPWTLYNSADKAAKDFAKRYYNIANSKQREYGAFIYTFKVRINGRVKRFYFYATVFKGGHDNVVFGFVYGYLALPKIKIDIRVYGVRVKATLKPMAFVHTHPKCSCHLGNEFSEPDILLGCLPGIDYVYAATPSHKLLKIGKYGHGFSNKLTF